jgi:hypothetical protein
MSKHIAHETVTERVLQQRIKNYDNSFCRVNGLIVTDIKLHFTELWLVSQ